MVCLNMLLTCKWKVSSGTMKWKKDDIRNLGLQEEEAVGHLRNAITGMELHLQFVRQFVSRWQLSEVRI